MVGNRGSVTSQQILLHVLFWVTYVILGGILTGIDTHAYTDGIVAEAIMLPVKMALTYYVLLVSVPMFAEDAQRGRAIFLTICAFIGAMLIYRLVLAGIIRPMQMPDRPIDFWNPRGFLLVAFDLFTAAAAAVSVKLTRMYIRSKRRQEVLEKEKLRSELNYLRTQTNPHYLFNTLNTLYGLALRRDEHTPEAILRLSQIMDFTLHQSRKHAVPLEEEVRILRNMIDLEKLRSAQLPDIQIVEQIDDPKVVIAPMLLVPFVENAFKHGVATAPNAPFVHVKIEQEDDQLLFQVSNNFKPSRSESNTESLGLDNVQRQLELLYGEQYVLKVSNNGGLHEVYLKLKLSALMPE